MTLVDTLAFALMLTGALFALLASIGLVRLPDAYCRLSATSKATPFGIGLLLAGASLALGDLDFAVRALLVVVFLGLTAPVAAHALGRAAHRAGIPPSEETYLEHPRTSERAAREDYGAVTSNQSPSVRDTFEEPTSNGSADSPCQ